MDKTGTMLQIAGICAVIGPVLLLIADLIHIFAGYNFEWTIMLWLALMLMIPATIGLTYLLARDGSSAGIIGGCFAFFGLTAGASMQVLFRVYAVLDEAGSTATIEQLRSTFKLIASTQMIGLAWPVGLLILAIACFRLRSVSVVVPVVLILGAITFPIGRIGNVAWAIIFSGVTFVVGYGLLAPHIFAAAASGNGGPKIEG